MRPAIRFLIDRSGQGDQDEALQPGQDYTAKRYAYLYNRFVYCVYYLADIQWE